MIFVVTAILFGTVSFAVCQAWLIRQLRNHYSTPSSVWPSTQRWPKAAVVLSLRGNDPFLESCLRNLVQQDYPDFFLQVVVDSVADPAWNAIRAVQTELGDKCLRVSVLTERRSSCSLKNSSIIQAIKSLADDCEVVAFVDADAITHPTWLRELVTPLADPDVGCSTGIRWFAPTDRSFATRMRCYWNLIAASVIYHSSTPWGGSMVVRREVLDSGLTEEWSRMFCEDAHTINYLQERGLKLACVPEATVVNQETTTISGCVRFVNRQMLIFRLYHKQWPSVVAFIAFAATLRSIHIFYLFHTLIQADWANFVMLACIHPIILLATQYEALQLDRAVRKMVGRNGRSIPANPTLEYFGFFCSEVMSLTSMLSAFATRFVSWRGVSYKVGGPQDITMLAYHPFAEANDNAVMSTTTVI